MTLDPESQSSLMRAARLVPDAARDSFFSEVAARLKHLRQITPTDTRYACSAVLGELRHDSRRLRTG